MRVAGILRVPTIRSRDILLQAKGDHLDRVHSDQMVLEMIRRGRLVRQSSSSAEAKSLKAKAKGLSSYHSNETAAEAARREARGPSLRATLTGNMLKGNHQARVHSDQMVLVAVRREAGLVGPKPSGGQRRSRGELENSSRQPRDLTKLGQKAARQTNSSPLKRRQYSLFLGVW